MTDRVNNTPQNAYDYFYGNETLQFSFLRIPKLLLTEPEFKKMSNDAKVLFGLLFDRTMLSQKNNWLDDQGRIYIIYTIQEIAEDLNISRESAIKRLQELVKFGLVVKKKEGLGRPDKLYVKNFMRGVFTQKSEISTSGSRNNKSLEVDNTDVMKSDSSTSGSRNKKPSEVDNSDPNNTYNNNTSNNNNQPTESEEMISGRLVDIICDNIDYSPDKYPDPGDQAMFDSLFDLICEILHTKAETIKINKQDYPAATVKSVFMKLKAANVNYVMRYMKENSADIRNMKGYLTTLLYNSCFTGSFYWQNRVNRDMYGKNDEE